MFNCTEQQYHFKLFSWLLALRQNKLACLFTANLVKLVYYMQVGLGVYLKIMVPEGATLEHARGQML
jgi:hypothetical protein